MTKATRIFNTIVLQLIFNLSAIFLWFLIVSDFGGNYKGEPLWYKIEWFGALFLLSLPFFPAAIIYTSKLEPKKKRKYLWATPVVYGVLISIFIFYLANTLPDGGGLALVAFILFLVLCFAGFALINIILSFTARLSIENQTTRLVIIFSTLLLIDIMYMQRIITFSFNFLN